MARKRKQEEIPVKSSWMNTFADLMNLLLCFFVLLFSMSTIDADKYEQLVTSMSESISIFQDGAVTVGDGAFISTGTDQIVTISQYYNEFEESGKNSDAHKSDGSDADLDGNGANPDVTDQAVADALEKKEAALADARRRRTEEMYHEIMGQAQKGNIEDDLTVNMDKNYTYVQVSLSGAILFDSGTAEIKKSARSLISKVGDILQMYDDHMIKIEGHTDNVPISSSQYKSNRWLSTARATQVCEYLEKYKKLKPENLEATGRGEYEPVASNKTEKGRAQNRRVEIKIYTDN